jgi:hypothetical protein
VETQPKIAFRWASTDDQPALLQLLIDAFGQWPYVEICGEPFDHLIWKYEDIGVQNGRHGIAVADGRIAGAIPLLTRTFLVDGRAMRAATAVDVAVLPDYRRSGLYMDLQWFTRREYRNSVDFNFGYAAPDPGMARVREKLGGWKIMAHELHMLAADVQHAPPVQTDAGVTIESAARVDEGLDALCREAMAPFRLVPVRDARYLNWRYYDKRGGASTVLLARRGDELLGYAALRVSKGKGYLADVLVLPGRTDVAASLASEALRRLQAAGVEKAECWIPASHPYRKALAEAGFSRLRRTKRFTYEPLQATEADLSFLDDREASAHLTAGDTDLI